MPTVTWNPSDKSGDRVSLYNSNLEAERVSPTNLYDGVRGTHGYSTGKRYVEYKIITAENPGDAVLVGIVSIDGGFDFQSNLTARLLWRENGDLWKDAVNAGAFGGGTLSTNDLVRLAFKASTREVWLAKNAGAWVGGGDPATETTPTTTITGTDAQYPAYFTNNDQATTRVRLKAHADEFVYSVPSGFTAWDDFIVGVGTHQTIFRVRNPGGFMYT